MREHSLNIRDMYIPREPEKVVAKPESSRSRIYFYLTALVFIAGFCFLGFWKGFSWFVEYPYFHLEKININGVERLQSKEIMDLINLHMGSRLLKLDLQNLHHQILSHPWVSECRVKRQMPDTLDIEIVETRPACILKVQMAYLIDDQGTILAKSDHVDENTVPVIKGSSIMNKLDVGGKIHNPLLDKALIWINSIQSNPVFQNRLRMVDVEDERNFKLYFSGIEAPINVGADFEYKKLLRLSIFLKYVETGNNEFEYIDLRFSNRIIMKPGSSIQR